MRGQYIHELRVIIKFHLTQGCTLYGVAAAQCNMIQWRRE